GGMAGTGCSAPASCVSAALSASGDGFQRPGGPPSSSTRIWEQQCAIERAAQRARADEARQAQSVDDTSGNTPHVLGGTGTSGRAREAGREPHSSSGWVSASSSTGSTEPPGTAGEPVQSVQPVQPAEPTPTVFMIFGGEGHKVFLGCLCNKLEADS